MSNWWTTATTEQRLTQVDAGIELGLTARQIALASGAAYKSVAAFIHYHGRKTAKTSAGSSRTGLSGRRIRWAAEYFTPRAPRPKDLYEQMMGGAA